jgi:hypothetical protein
MQMAGSTNLWVVDTGHTCICDVIRSDFLFLFSYSTLHDYDELQHMSFSWRLLPFFFFCQKRNEKKNVEEEEVMGVKALDCLCLAVLISVRCITTFTTFITFLSRFY